MLQHSTQDLNVGQILFDPVLVFGLFLEQSVVLSFLIVDLLLLHFEFVFKTLTFHIKFINFISEL
jgi:hypothetical protein